MRQNRNDRSRFQPQEDLKHETSKESLQKSSSHNINQEQISDIHPEDEGQPSMLQANDQVIKIIEASQGTDQSEVLQNTSKSDTFENGVGQNPLSEKPRSHRRDQNSDSEGNDGYP